MNAKHRKKMTVSFVVMFGKIMSK